MERKNCSSCKAPIYFLITKNGKRMPVDSKSLNSEEKREVEAGREVIFIYNKHISHFATCPNAKKFRKEKDNG